MFSIFDRIFQAVSGIPEPSLEYELFNSHFPKHEIQRRCCVHFAASEIFPWLFPKSSVKWDLEKSVF